MNTEIPWQQNFVAVPGREKIGKICRISGEKLVFSQQISRICLLWKAAKLCKFTARVSGELRKIHLIAALTTCYRPFTDANLSPPVSQPLLLPLSHSSYKSIIFVLNLTQIHSNFCKTNELNFCKISGEMWKFFCQFTAYSSGEIT